MKENTNVDKSEIMMIIRRVGDGESKWRGSKLEGVGRPLRILGSIVSYVGGMEADLENRATNETGMYHAVNKTCLEKIPRR